MAEFGWWTIFIVAFGLLVVPCEAAKSWAFERMDSTLLNPPVSATANRTGYFYHMIDDATNELDVEIVAANLFGPVTKITLHCDPNGVQTCSPSQNCPVCLDIGVLGAQDYSSSVLGTPALPLKVSTIVDAGVAGRIRSSNVYYVISTKTFPNGELRGDGFQANKATLPTHKAELRNDDYYATAYATLQSNNVLAFSMRHTVPNQQTQTIRYINGPLGEANRPIFPWSNLGFSAPFEVVATTPCQAECSTSIGQLLVGIEVVDTAGKSMAGQLNDLSFSPINAALTAGQMSAAVWPPKARGSAHGKLTIAAAFPNISNLGNEIWVTAPSGFAFNSTSTTVAHSIGLPSPDSLHIDGNKIQLRWNMTALPFSPGSRLTYTAVLTHVQLPMSCIPKPFKLETAKCTSVDVLNAGVLMKRVCDPMDTVSITATPATGVPTGCGGCSDAAGWRDWHGNTCTDLVQKGLCGAGKDTHPTGLSWQQELHEMFVGPDGVPKAYSIGMDATEACCACGKQEPYSCGGCKYLYTSPEDYSRVFTCDHMGVTVLRVNVSSTETCTFGSP
uniref:CHRD domain-containing protein n=1 Tax=Eutreptiella gymnastica TaxID=73025 RepID=A0A7S1N3R6_9EUGL|mmetsp:Transcript_11260/g.20284  ORF Transcript_11260/g.20284 Transcript_11260/m.20284 type:complete len:559 (+) Transcript_11260:77-1753(+)